MKRFLTAGALASTIILGGFGATTLAYSPDADARSFSRSSFRSSSSWSSSSSKSWSSKSTSSKSSNKSLFSTHNSKSKPKASTAKASFKKVDVKKKVVSSPKHLTKQRAQFKKAPKVGNATVSTNYRSAAVRNTYDKKYTNNSLYSKAKYADRRTYETRRNRYYSGYDVPTYVYGGAPSYGLWDAMFLYFMLDSVTNASQFAHHHQNDPDYQAWRAEADELAKANKELAAQLERIDAEAAKVSGPIQPDFLPKGTDVDIALSQEALNATKPVMKMCTGETGGAYVLIGATANSVTDDVRVEIVKTSGSRENLEKIQRGECDAAVVQRDSYWNFVEETGVQSLNFERMSVVGKESLMMVCNSPKAGDVSEMVETGTKLHLVNGSGSAETWKNLVVENLEYSKVPVINTDTFKESIVKTRATSNSCSLYVGMPGLVPEMRTIDGSAKSHNLTLIDFRDDNLVKTTDPSNQEVYAQSEVDSSVYPNLLRDNGVLFGSGDLWTLTTPTDLIVSLDWKKKYKSAYYSAANDTAQIAGKLKKMGAQ